MSGRYEEASTSGSETELLDRVTPLPISKSTRKRPRSSVDFFELLMCPICMDYFIPPVVNCRKGHSYCITCIDKMESVMGDTRCPQCRAPVDKDCRNHLIEDQLEKVTIGCIWRQQGCKLRVSLNDRHSHERTCDYRPGSAKCYFSDPLHNHSCDWTGNPLKLAKHLQKMHDLEPITRSKIVKFLWNPPREDEIRFRYRILKMNYPSNGKNTTKFLLEHFYDPEYKVLLFLVRTFDPETKLNYKISILNRKNELNRLLHAATTVDLEEVGPISEYPKYDKKNVLVIPFNVLEDYCFYYEDDQQSYFSMHVEFDYMTVTEDVPAQ
jgi:hypothetical protein